MEIKVVRFSSGFGNVPDTFLLMPKDYWYTTERQSEARIYELPDGFELVEGGGNMEFFAIDQGNICYEVFNDDGTLVLSPAPYQDADNKCIILGEWE